MPAPNQGRASIGCMCGMLQTKTLMSDGVVGGKKKAAKENNTKELEESGVKNEESDGGRSGGC